MMVRVPDVSLGASDPIPNMAKGKTRQLLDTSRYLGYSASIADILSLMYPFSRSSCSQMASSLLSTAMTMYLVLAVSVFLYGTFYYAYMPVELANIPVIIWVYGCHFIFQFIR